MKNLYKTEQDIYKLIQNMGVESTNIIPNANFLKDLGFDSLDKAELIMNIENYFNISITDDIASKIQTVQEVVEYVFKKQMIPEAEQN